MAWIATPHSKQPSMDEEYTPSILESRTPWLKSWLCMIFSMMSSASTRVAFTLFSWFSIEFCFIGVLKTVQIRQNITLMWQMPAFFRLYRLCVCYLGGLEGVEGRSVAEMVGVVLLSLSPLSACWSPCSRMLPMPVEADPAETLRLWPRSVRLEWWEL